MAPVEDAVRSLEDRSEDTALRQLLTADSLLATGHLTDAFVIYRSVEAQLMPGYDDPPTPHLKKDK